MFVALGPFARKTLLLGRVAFACVMFVGANAPAQSKPVAPPTKPAETNPAEKKPAPRRARASVSRIAEALAADLQHIPAKTLIVSAPLVSDTPVAKGAELVTLLATQLAGRRGADNRAFAKPLSLAEARLEARAADALVMLELQIAAGKLRVVANVFPVPRTVWARIRDPEPGPIAHAFAEAPVDAEVRTYLEPVPMTPVIVTRGQNFEADIVALGCADLDADGATEIMSVSRRRVTTVRLRDGKVVPLRSRSWPELSPQAPFPLREPVGFAALVERPKETGEASLFVEVGLSDRSKTVRLDGQLATVATFSGLSLGTGEASACVHVAQPFVAGPLVPCAPGDAPLGVNLTGLYDSLASASLVTPKGEGYAIVAARTDRGVVEVRDEAGHVTTIDGAGAQLAVGDLDQDGEPEILSSLDVAPGSTDAVVVRSWVHHAAGDGLRPKEIMRVPAAAGVRALAVCPPDGPGRTPFVVATADEIWVVR